MVNPDLLRQRAQEIRQALGRLSGYSQRPLDEFLADPTALDAAKYRMLVAIEAAISMCAHLTAHRSVRTPDSYAECFDVLAEDGTITPGLAQRLGNMARFRNLLMHMYGTVDDRQFWRILRSDVQDLDTFLRELGRAIPGLE